MKGFTLIETVIYIALLGLIMSLALLGAYQILEASAGASNKTTLQEESSFILRKINWAMTGISAAPTVGGSGCTQTLHTAKYDGTTVDIRLNGGNVEMRENALSYAPITTANVATSCLTFQAISVGTVSGVSAIVTINANNFVTTKYLRK
jgi:Tfp pilus assembly protein PilE